MKFTDLGLCDELSEAVADLGYESQTPIQEKSILEEHKDHRHQAWARDLRKWEMDQLDEAAGSRFYQQTRAAQAESGENDL